MANILTGILSGLGRGALDRRRELRQRSEALTMDEENYQRQLARRRAEEQENYATSQARRIQEAERLKSLALQDAIETEMAIKALMGGTTDALNMAMQNIPGAPTMADIAMIEQAKKDEMGRLKNQIEQSRLNYWQSRANSAALKTGRGGGSGSSKSAAIKPGKFTEDQRSRLRFVERDLNRLKDRLVKEELYTGESFNPSAVSMLKDRISKLEKERQGILGEVPGAKPKQPGISKNAENFLKQLKEISEAVRPK